MPETVGQFEISVIFGSRCILFDALSLACSNLVDGLKDSSLPLTAGFSTSVPLLGMARGSHENHPATRLNSPVSQIQL
jgi:hypothetical protein